MAAVSSGCYIIDRDFNVVDVNETARNIYPQLQVGKKCYHCLLGLDEPCGPCPVVRGIVGPQVYQDPIRGITETVDAMNLDYPGHGPCHAMIFSTVGENATFAATLPTTQDELRNLALIKALTTDFYDVFTVDLNTDEMVLFRHKGKPADRASDYKVTSYSTGIERYIQRHVIPEDREMMRRKLQLPYIIDHLKKTESITIHYRVFWQEAVHYFYRKIGRIGDAEDFDYIVVGVGCEDEEVLARQERETLEKNLTSVEYDSLTGLYTREAFLVHAAELFREHPEERYDFCVSRISNLDLISHQYGHLAAEHLVALVGRKLKERSTDENCITYLGNGLFASYTVTEPRDSRKATVFAFRDDILASSAIRHVSLKWAIYVNVPRALSVEEAISCTQYALSMLRSDAGDDYIEFDKVVLEKMEWEENVRDCFEEALKHGEFVPWYQPKYSARTKEITGAEALVRWIRPDGTMIPPNQFIPILETWGKIGQLDECIFRQVCEFQSRLRKQGLPLLPISVNLSRASMLTEDVGARYLRIAREYDLDPRLMPIEITESVAVRAVSIRNFAEELISAGFILHMDDFGSGYSSLASLQILPFRCIKLDKTLIDFIGKESGESLLRHTIALAREYGLTVVAEGVETMEQYIFLRALGCDAIQGYLFSPPIKEENYTKLLK